ncbi:hypothetical protein MAHJHV34_19730 [Mycobacterium avium subsp. hominissuis]
MLVGRDRVLGGQRAHPGQRLEADRAHHDELFRHRLEQQVDLTDQGCQLRLDAGRRDQLFEGLQPGTALAAEGHRVGLAGRQAVDQSMRVPGWWVLAPVRALPIAVGGHPVVLVDRHVLCLP